MCNVAQPYQYSGKRKNGMLFSPIRLAKPEVWCWWECPEQAHNSHTVGVIMSLKKNLKQFNLVKLRTLQTWGDTRSAVLTQATINTSKTPCRPLDLCSQSELRETRAGC